MEHIKQKPSRPKILPQWAKGDLPRYKEVLQECLQPLPPVSDPEDAINYLTRSLQKAASIAIPNNPRRKTPTTKPWNNEIKRLFKESKVADCEWKTAGKPRSPDLLFMKRKNLKSAIRTAQRIERAKQRESNIANVMAADAGDKSMFFQLIRKQRNNPDPTVSCLNYEGKLHSGDPLPVWTNHFSTLALPSENVNYNDNYKAQVENDIALIRKIETPTTSIPITSYEVGQIIDNLKKKRSADEYSLCAEHLIHGGKPVINFLTGIINAIINQKKIPQCLKTAIMIPIPKKGKDKSIPGNSRGISICPVLAKVIDNILTTHQRAAINETKTPLQFGFTKGRSPSHATVLVSELLADAKDIRRAHSSLEYRMYKKC